MAASEPSRRVVCRARLLGLLLALAAGTRLPAGQAFTAFCYHDVEDQPSRTVADTHSLSRLVEHFEWFKADGWTVISVDDLLEARAGRRPLPPKAVLLTFDDGYVSFATRVLPLLEAYRYPAVFAFVTSWLEIPPDKQVNYGGTLVPRDRFVTPEQLRRIAASPWVEIASHSHDLHRGLLANREGNELPAAIARRYDQVKDSYEDAAAFSARVRADLEKSADALQAMTGRRPRTLAWPFGRFNQTGIEAAHAAGFTVLFGLNSENGDTDHLEAIPRFYPSGNPGAPELEQFIRPPTQPGLHRFATVDPATVINAPDHDAREVALGGLIDSVSMLGLTAIHLEAFSDGDGDGRPDTAFFPGTHFTTKPGYFNRLAWQLHTRGGVDVVLRLPLATTDETDWIALGEAVYFSGVMFTDFVSGRDDPARLRAALQVLRRYQPAVQLHLRVPAAPDQAGDWAALEPTLVWPDRPAGPDLPAGWLHTPAARGRVALSLTPAEATDTSDWLARGVVHFGLAGPPPAKTAVSPALQRALSARTDPFFRP